MAGRWRRRWRAQGEALIADGPDLPHRRAEEAGVLRGDGVGLLAKGESDPDLVPDRALAPYLGPCYYSCLDPPRWAAPWEGRCPVVRYPDHMLICRLPPFLFAQLPQSHHTTPRANAL